MIPICFDLETRPPTMTAKDKIAAALKSKANPARKPDTRAEWASRPENYNAVWSKLAVDPFRCVVVAWALTVDGEPIVSASDWHSERRTLTQLAGTVQAACGTSRPLWVGHNIANFDLPILLHRARKWGMSWLARSMPDKPWSPCMHDNMLQVAPMTRGVKWESADFLAREYTGQGKDQGHEIDWSAFYSDPPDNAAQLLEDRCRDDVAVEWATYCAMSI